MKATNGACVDLPPILVVEDSPEDFEATRRGLTTAGLANPVVRCSDGDEALRFLFREGEFAHPEAAPRPGLILLDLNLPGTDGREVLTRLKADSGLRVIPTIVLTTSSDPIDIKRVYEGGANSYVTKPVDFDGLVTALQRLTDYWFGIVVLPRAG